MFKTLKIILGLSRHTEPARRSRFMYDWEDQMHVSIENQPVDSLFADVQTFERKGSFPWLRDIGPGRSSTGDGTPVLHVTVADRYVAEDEYYVGPPEKFQIGRRELIEGYREARHSKQLCCDGQLTMGGLGAGCVYDFSAILQNACYGEALFGKDGFGRPF